MALPLLTACTRLPESDAKTATIYDNLEIQFAGQTAHYKQILFQLTLQGSKTKIPGAISATPSDLKIELPTLLTLPVKNELPSAWK